RGEVLRQRPVHLLRQQQAMDQHAGPRAGTERGVGEPLAVVLEVRHQRWMFAAVRWASAMVVIIGFVPDALGNALASPIHTPGVSCSCPHGSATDVAASLPIRADPMWCNENVACS